MKGKGTTWSSGAHGEGLGHWQQSAFCDCTTCPGTVLTNTHVYTTGTHTHSLSPLSPSLSMTSILQIAEFVTCNPWVRKMSENISLTPNLLPPLPHKPHSKVTQRAMGVHWCICSCFLCLGRRDRPMISQHTLLTFCIRNLRDTVSEAPSSPLWDQWNHQPPSKIHRKGWWVHFLTETTYSSHSFKPDIYISYVTGRQSS